MPILFRPLWKCVIVVFVALAGLFFLAVSLHAGWHTHIDQQAFACCDFMQSATFTRLARAFSFMGTGTFLIPLYGFLAYTCVRAGKARNAVFVIALAAGSLLLGWLLKAVFHVQRPPHPLIHGAGGCSFPSGHALGGFTLLMILIYLSRNLPFTRAQRWLAVLPGIFLAAGIAWSRVYFHVHFATDVIGSVIAVTLAWALVRIIFLCVSPRLSEADPNEEEGEEEEDEFAQRMPGWLRLRDMLR